jgi:hypothetical protein
MTNIPLPRRGAKIYRTLDLDETAAGQVVKAKPGCILAMYVTNKATSVRYLKIYNKASGVTVGTTAPVMTVGIPGNSSDNILAALGAGGVGIGFDTGIIIAATTGLADNDTGAPGTNDLIVNVIYI